MTTTDMDKPSTTGLEPRFARELGRQLKALRERRRESEDDVGRRLLMSANQIRSLERGDGEPFYGPRYHIQAARKYATISGLDFEALRAEVLANEVPGSNAADDEADPGRTSIAGMPDATAGDATAGDATAGGRIPGPAAADRPRFGYRVVYALAILAVVIAVSVAVSRSNSPSNTSVATPVPVPAAPTADASTAASSQREASVQTTPGTDSGSRSPGASAGQLLIAFNGSTTLQTRHQDGTREVRRFRAKQTVTLERNDLETVVIGDWRKATLTVEGKRIDLSRYRKVGSREVRIGGARLRKLGD